MKEKTDDTSSCVGLLSFFFHQDCPDRLEDWSRRRRGRRSSGENPLASGPPRPSAENFDNIQDADFEDLTPHGDGKTPPPPKPS